ncbi:enoyl-CoA-hydratase DpgB [Streptomyces sp. NPDC058470]|uniref:enoyl-CoA-hydratase DpgB n=1 Tax=Streptomyces sp. NPDC058470 TaxID=3346515 RepID=UPI00365DBE99
MNTRESMPQTDGLHDGADEVVLRIDGRQALSAEWIGVVSAACDSAEDRGGRSRVVVHVSGAPEEPWAGNPTVSLVSKWERALRRLERLPAATVAVAADDCGGLALDALLATDYRIATPSVRLLLPAGEGGTWPGMALYRLGRHGASGSVIRRALLFGTPVEVSEALALHLVDELSDDPARTLALARERLATVSGTELAIRRQLMLDASTTGFEEALGAHLAACDRTLRRAAVAAGGAAS